MTMTVDELIAKGWRMNNRKKFTKRTWKRKSQRQASELEQGGSEPPEEEKAVTTFEDRINESEQEVDSISEPTDEEDEDDELGNDEE